MKEGEREAIKKMTMGRRRSEGKEGDTNSEVGIF
jgi:hypothetical protein